MYRTARAAIYDVLDTVIINVVVTEYDATPGTCQPATYTWSTTLPGHGDYDPQVWVRRALEALMEEVI